MLEIRDLHASVNDAEILRGLNLKVNAGELHAIMGPNGSGKSTLSKVLAGHPNYQVTSGDILYDINLRPKSLLELEAHERAREGIFLAYQYPVEVPGVTNASFLRESFNAICTHQGADTMDPIVFDAFLREKLRFLQMDESFIDRFVNVDFSGGEKKRNEILQMAVLSPRLAILDETDSGLDVDALRLVTDGIKKLRSDDRSIILITHYQRILAYLEPDFVHVLHAGRIVHSGGKELAVEIENRGYDWLLGRGAVAEERPYVQ